MHGLRPRTLPIIPNDSGLLTRGRFPPGVPDVKSLSSVNSLAGDTLGGDRCSVGGTSDMMSPTSLQSKRIATTALAPRPRAPCHIRSSAWFLLSVRSFVYPTTSPPTAVLSWAPRLLKTLRARTIRPKTSPRTAVIR
jgi:hypothetical protein